MKRSDQSLQAIPEVQSASPLVSEELSKLIAKGHQLRAAIQQLEQVKTRLKELVLEQGLASEEGLNGARIGPYGCIISNRKGKRYLNREALVDAGVTPGQIEAGMKTGKGSTAVEFFEIGTPWEDEEES